ncbi:PTS sugar transporter subunit IIB [Desulfovibrio aminophilus]|uniref:PTS sugar transporter subunit IIB n=1 Tax=Desulfovibrio aminophilus TaxID=81425 RepID=UPI0033940D23
MSLESLWVRIDNRLIHGQVIEAWLPYTGASTIIVANDEVAGDSIQQEIMSLAIPQNTASLFVHVERTQLALVQAMSGHPLAALVLFSSCADARRAFERGFQFESLNVGNIHYKPGRRQISPSVALSTDDESCLRFFSQQGVNLDFRCVPNDPVQARFK